MTDLTDENAIYFHGHQFAEQLSKGLADNWSQVRLELFSFLCLPYTLPYFQDKHTKYPIPEYCMDRS